MESIFKQKSIVKKINDNTILIDTINGEMFGGINKHVFIEFNKIYQTFSPEDTINLILTTSGGGMTYCLMIADILSKHKGHTVIKIPSLSFSEGTLIALSCKEIQLSSCSYLSSINFQVSSFVPLSLAYLRSILQYPADDANSFMKITCSYLEKYCSDIHGQYMSTINDIFKRLYTEEQIPDLKYLFLEKYRTNTPINKDQLPEFLNVTDYDYKKEETLPNVDFPTPVSIEPSFPNPCLPEELNMTTMTIGKNESVEDFLNKSIDSDFDDLEFEEEPVKPKVNEATSKTSQRLKKKR